MKWKEFWDTFESTIDQNTELSDIEKMHYLNSKLSGEAKNAVSGIMLSNENYTVVTTLLKERFEDNQVVLHNHNIELININPATSTSKGLRFMHDQMEKHFRSLEVSHQDMTHDIFIPIIISKVPKDILLQLEIQKRRRKIWSVSMLREQLNNYVYATERAEQQHYSTKADHINRFPRCRFCKGRRWSGQCLVYPTVEERKEIIKDSCFLCLKESHIAWKCLLSKTCVHCGRMNHHHRSLC